MNPHPESGFSPDDPPWSLHNLGETRPCGCRAAQRWLQARAQSLPREETGRLGPAVSEAAILWLKGAEAELGKQNSGELRAQTVELTAGRPESRHSPFPPISTSPSLSRDVVPSTLTISRLPEGPGVLAADIPIYAGRKATESGPLGEDTAGKVRPRAPAAGRHKSAAKSRKPSCLLQLHA
ncbi:hypothetical protein P7K49_033913 [Saguinus oedipus]|uniref:Uncharacterized protein n=1 Tax=Saguinus oedipus TaxID=9490 RepID=A0ABQ9TTA1_SAGOE|nr:hypothetical protein P7K49_033913 [Saguinus oedipus]